MAGRKAGDLADECRQVEAGSRQSDEVSMTVTGWFKKQTKKVAERVRQVGDLPQGSPLLQTGLQRCGDGVAKGDWAHHKKTTERGWAPLDGLFMETTEVISLHPSTHPQRMKHRAPMASAVTCLLGFDAQKSSRFIWPRWPDPYFRFAAVCNQIAASLK